MNQEPRDVRELLDALNFDTVTLNYYEIVQMEMARNGCERWPLFDPIEGRDLQDRGSKTVRIARAVD